MLQLFAIPWPDCAVVYTKGADGRFQCIRPPTTEFFPTGCLDGDSTVLPGRPGPDAPSTQAINYAVSKQQRRPCLSWDGRVVSCLGLGEWRSGSSFNGKQPLDRQICGPLRSAIHGGRAVARDTARNRMAGRGRRIHGFPSERCTAGACWEPLPRLTCHTGHAAGVSKAPRWTGTRSE